MKLRYSILAVAAALALGSNVAWSDEAAAKRWVDNEFQPSTLSKDKQMAEMKWFIDAAKKLQAKGVKEISVVSETITTHEYEAKTLAKAAHDPLRPNFLKYLISHIKRVLLKTAQLLKERACVAFVWIGAIGEASKWSPVVSNPCGFKQEDIHALGTSAVNPPVCPETWLRAGPRFHPRSRPDRIGSGVRASGGAGREGRQVTDDRIARDPADDAAVALQDAAGH